MAPFIKFYLKRTLKKSWIWIMIFSFISFSLFAMPEWAGMGILAPGFFLWAPTIIGLLIIPLSINDMKNTSTIKRIGQLGLTKVQFTLSLLLVAGMLCTVTFFINLIVLISINGMTGGLLLSATNWGQFIFSYIFYCILVSTTGIAFSLIIHSKVLTTLIMVLVIIYIIVLGDQGVSWSKLADVNGFVISPTIKTIQAAVPWTYMSSVFVNSCFGFNTSADFWLSSVTSLLLSGAFVMFNFRFFKFEKIR